MKILTLADQEVDVLYGPALRDYAEGVECVLACGDLPLDYLDYIISTLNKPLFYVHGNHTQTRIDKLTGQTSDAVQGAVNVHGRVVNYRGLLIAGLEGCQRYRKGDHQYTPAEMGWHAIALGARLLARLPSHGRALDILITHAPPLGIHDEPNLTHRGFPAFLPLMRLFKPRYLVHGHTHIYRNDQPRRTWYHQTEVVNTFGYQILEIDVPPGRGTR